MYSEVEMMDFLFPECEIKKTLEQEEDICFDNFLREISEVDFYKWEQSLLNITQNELDSILDPVEHQTEEFKSSIMEFTLDDDVAQEQNILEQAIEEELGTWNFSDHDGLDYNTDMNPLILLEPPRSPSPQYFYNRPQEPYMEMIAKSILTSADQKLVLLQIYSYIRHKYPNFTETNRSWKNSVRHNLSTNPCFIKSGRAPNGRGFFWTIHPGCRPSFSKGNFHRRDAIRGVQNFRVGVQSRHSLNHHNRTEPPQLNTQTLRTSNKNYYTNKQQDRKRYQNTIQHHIEYTRMQSTSMEKENIHTMFCF